MNASRHHRQLQKVYRIQVEGMLDESWSDFFSGMEIQHEIGEEGAILTSLTGPVADQPALRGLLSKLMDLNLVLISINPVEVDP